MSWYQIKTANEFTGVDATMGTGDIAQLRNLKQNQFSPWLPQGLPGDMTYMGLVSDDNLPHGIRVTFCGEEIGADSRKCCGAPAEYLSWYPYEDLNGYQAYECTKCHHKNKTFDISVTKNKQKKKDRRNKHQKVKRLSRYITQRGFTKIAQHPSGAPGGYNNPANTMMGRLDLSEDQRIVPWDKINDSIESEYDHRKQKNNKDYKLVKMIDKDGNEKWVKIKRRNTGGDGIGQANTFNQRGRIKKRPRYNPHPGSKQKSPGAWQHNRNVGREGWYGQPDPGNSSNADGRQRVLSWGEYMQSRGPGTMAIPH